MNQNCLAYDELKTTFRYVVVSSDETKRKFAQNTLHVFQEPI